MQGRVHSYVADGISLSPGAADVHGLEWGQSRAQVQDRVPSRARDRGGARRAGPGLRWAGQGQGPGSGTRAPRGGAGNRGGVGARAKVGAEPGTGDGPRPRTQEQG